MSNKYLNILTFSIILITSTACNYFDETDEHGRQIQCNGQQANIIFTNKTAKLIINETTYQLNRVIVASGEKYQGDNALVWLKGDDALIEINNIRLAHCQLIQ